MHLTNVQKNNHLFATDNFLLLKLVANKKHDYLYFEYPEKSGQVAIIKGHMKGVKSNMKQNAGSWEVFDLSTDRKEQTNLADKNPGLIAEFESIIRKEHWNATITD